MFYIAIYSCLKLWSTIFWFSLCLEMLVTFDPSVNMKNLRWKKSLKLDKGKPLSGDSFLDSLHPYFWRYIFAFHSEECSVTSKFHSVWIKQLMSMVQMQSLTDRNMKYFEEGISCSFPQFFLDRRWWWTQIRAGG